MGASAENRYDAWLRSGGAVVTSSDRAARALRTAFDRARRAEGLSAWAVPHVLDWKSFVRRSWEERSRDGRLLLNPTQEQSLWAGIAGESRRLATLLEGPRHRLATMAMEAHGLLCSFAPQFLAASARSTWQQDAAAFSSWLGSFEEICNESGLLSPGRLPIELLPLLEADNSARPPLLLAGFDRLLPAQRRLFDVWGEWSELEPAQPADQVQFLQATDPQAELASCAVWCARRLAQDPAARLLVVTRDVAARRGEIERAFLNFVPPASSAAPGFEFSLGVPLSQIGLARGAFLLLRWLDGILHEQELDWLLSTGQIASSSQESIALQTYMRLLRRRGLERTHWTLPEFIAQRTASNSLPPAWVERIAASEHQLTGSQSPVDWAALVPQLLRSAGWPGFRSLSSVEFQAYDRFLLACDAAGSLGFDGRRISWQEFLGALRRTLAETLFAPESHDAPIQIAGPAESAGLSADAVSFLGATEDSWPASGPTHPLLPAEIQRQAGMPHGSAQLDWDLARAMTFRLLASAPEVRFSFALRDEQSDARPSRLILEIANEPQPMPAEFAPPLPPLPATVLLEDFSRIPFPPGQAAGGSGVLTAQSQCAFKAFATARLAAKGWELAEPCLTASQRGNLLHAVLHAIWAGPPLGIRSHLDLLKLPDRAAFVAGHVERVLAHQLPPGLRRRIPRRYLELEQQRLTRLVAEWLGYEATRYPFAVAHTEVDSTVTLAGLSLRLRLDRVDRLLDRSLLVIDYKTGDVSPKAWALPRPDDVQLPLYAGFALDRSEEELGGLVFAKVRPGDLCFAGQVGDARGTLLETLSPNSSLVKNPLTIEQLIDWRDHIEQLARDFMAGHAEVDPREYPKTCARCGLQTLCRIQESQETQILLADEPATIAPGGADE